MKFSFFVLAAALFVFPSQSQTVKAIIENQSAFYQHFRFEENKVNMMPYMAGNDVVQVECTGLRMKVGGGSYSYFTHALIIRKADASGKQIAINELEKGERKFGPVESESVEFDGRILIFYFRYINEDTMKLYVSEVDKNSLAVGNTVSLFSYPQKNVGLFKLMKQFRKKLIVRKSPDNSKLIVVTPGREDEYFSCVFDKGLSILRQKTSKFEGSDDLDISSTAVDNAGNSVTVFSDLEYNMSTYRSSRVKMVLLQKSNNTEQMTDVNALSPELKLYNGRVQCSKEPSKFYVFGDYKGEFVRAGVWYTEVRATKPRPGEVRTIAYPEEFRKKIYESGFGVRKGGAMEVLGADWDIIELNNGDFAFGGTPMRESAATGSGSSAVPIYTVGPVMIIFIGKGKKTTFGMVHRWQSHNEGYKPVFVPYQDKIVAIFNTYEKNIDDPEGGSLNRKEGRDFGLVYAVFKNDGAVERQERLSPKDSKAYYYNTLGARILSDGKIVIPEGYHEKKTGTIEVATITVL